MNSIVIGIPTYRRPVMLRKLLNSLYGCSIDSKLIGKVQIVVVDNDILRSAEFVINEFKSCCPENFTLKYVSFPIKGLSNVRNKILDEAYKFKPTYIISIDDDEYVASNWLTEMINTAIECNADIVLGPVRPDFENKRLPTYISKYFYRPVRKNHQLVDEVAAGNLLLKTSFLIDNALKFDARFNTTGAEDTYFGIQVLKKNAKIHWAAGAIAYETIPNERSTLNWLIKRKYRTAITYTYILILEKEYNLLAKKLLVSILYLIWGLAGMVLFPLRVPNRYFGPLKLSESVGGLAAFFNFKYNEYN